MELPTVMIRADNIHGHKIINASDFDPDRHTLIGDDPQPEPQAGPQSKRGPGRPRKMRQGYGDHG